MALGKFIYKYVYYEYNMYIMYTYICMDVAIYVFVFKYS